MGNVSFQIHISTIQNYNCKTTVTSVFGQQQRRVRALNLFKIFRLLIYNCVKTI